MAIYLTEANVNSLLTMDMALDALDEVFRARAEGKVGNIPRARLPLGPTGRGSYNLMAASWPERGVVGHKSYAAGAVHVMLYGTGGEGLLAIIEASRMGQVRTGAASGVATRYMAREDASTVAVIGSGYQAETQLEAVAAVREITAAKVFSRTPERRNSYASRMSERLGFDVQPAESAEAAVAGSDIIVTVTNSAEPVITGEMLEMGVHINAAGGNSWTRRELDTHAVAMSDIVATDDIDQAKIECGELIWAADGGHFYWEQLVSLDRIVAGLRKGRNTPHQVTLFESQGVAFEDLAVCARLYKMAEEQSIGTRLPS
ncbi:MAG: ornithine cyclodeaminase family protein [Chloroflexi bacterium]|nr:ornithine cyclodeaminase family protein [Chloroflexota bacterium]MDA1297812.1 ornithine cyclodeaminase family protein [Chloroflexota bacterium]